MNTQSQHGCDKDVSNDKALKFIGQKKKSLSLPRLQELDLAPHQSTYSPSQFLTVPLDTHTG